MKSRNETHEKLDQGQGKGSWKEGHPNAMQGQLARWAPKRTKSRNETHEEPPRDARSAATKRTNVRNETHEEP